MRGIKDGDGDGGQSDGCRRAGVTVIVVVRECVVVMLMVV